MFVIAVVAVAVAMAAGARVQMESDVSFEKFSPRNWIKETTHLTDDDIVKCVFALKHDAEAMKSFEAKLLDASTPSSKNYGKWLSKQEIIAAVAPSASAVKVVTDFLATFGIINCTIFLYQTYWYHNRYYRR
jgi:hypothetical protein